MHNHPPTQKTRSHYKWATHHKLRLPRAPSHVQLAHPPLSPSRPLTTNLLARTHLPYIRHRPLASHPCSRKYIPVYRQRPKLRCGRQLLHSSITHSLLVHRPLSQPHPPILLLSLSLNTLYPSPNHNHIRNRSRNHSHSRSLCISPSYPTNLLPHHRSPASDMEAHRPLRLGTIIIIMVMVMVMVMVTIPAPIQQKTLPPSPPSSSMPHPKWCIHNRCSNCSSHRPYSNSA